jgi:hypothetical protein
MHAALQQHEGIGSATVGVGGRGNRRNSPGDAARYGVVEQHADAFFEGHEERGGALSRFVREEFEAYLRCGRLKHGFIGAKCTGCVVTSIWLRLGVSAAVGAHRAHRGA